MRRRTDFLLDDIPLRSARGFAVVSKYSLHKNKIKKYFEKQPVDNGLQTTDQTLDAGHGELYILAGIYIQYKKWW